MRAKPTSYRHHVTRHGDAGNVIGLRGRQVSRELRRDIDLSGGMCGQRMDPLRDSVPQQVDFGRQWSCGLVDCTDVKFDLKVCCGI